MYITAILNYLSWPAMIIISYLIIMRAVKNYEDVCIQEEENS